MMGKTGTKTATDGIIKEVGTLFPRVPTWTLSTNRTQEADWDTNDEAISFFFISFYLICLLNNSV
jgi:hypothetical protein